MKKTQNQNKQREDLCCKCFELVDSQKTNEKNAIHKHTKQDSLNAPWAFMGNHRFILLWLVQFDWHNKMILQVKTAFCFTKWESCLIKMRRESWRSEQWVIFLRQSHIRETFKESSSYSWTFERRGKKRKNHRNENWLKISTNCLSGFGAIVPSAVYH